VPVWTFLKKEEDQTLREKYNNLILYQIKMSPEDIFSLNIKEKRIKNGKRRAVLFQIETFCGKNDIMQQNKWVEVDGR